MAKASRAINDGNVSTDDLKYYQEQYDNAVARLEKIKSGANTSISTSVALQVAQYQLQIQQKEQALTDAQTAVEAVQTSVSNTQLDITDAEQAITNAQLDITDAQQSVKEAQSALDTEKSLSPTITAPIDGYITKVNVSGGDEVFKGTVAAIIADPSQFEADIMVTENDIFSVKLNGTATVSLDALSSVTYPAKITYISPTATVSSGVVNYSVTVALTSLTPISTTQTTAQTTAMTMPSGTPPAGFTPPAGGMPSGTPPAMPAQGTTAPVSAEASDNSTAAESSQTADLKDGLSATVEIISKQANNVLVIPDKAIKTQGQSYTVQVVKGTTTETQIVQTGMSDGTNTEITSGLSEGDQVVYTVSISSSSTSSTSSKSGSQIIPGVGGGGPPGGGF
jgi:multidrug efflux pump subunit AcrA (membrane-fusion protein)